MNNIAIHRRSENTVQQAAGVSTTGADNASCNMGVGAKATAAAQAPIKIGITV
jgi:hypothetical protein